MLVYENPACHLRPVRARQVFQPEAIIKRCAEDGKGGVLGGALEGHSNKGGDIEKERVLQASGRKESPDSRGIYTLGSATGCFHTSKA